MSVNVLIKLTKLKHKGKKKKKKTNKGKAINNIQVSPCKFIS